MSEFTNEQASPNPGRNIALIVLAGAAVTVVLCGVLLACGVGLSVMTNLGGETLSVTVSTPTSVSQSGVFAVSVVVYNDDSQIHMLHSIDVNNDYLSGVELIGSTPPYTASGPLPLFDQRTYFFERDIAPGETLTVEFEAIALAPGNYDSALEVCIDTAGNCTPYRLNTTITP